MKLEELRDTDFSDLGSAAIAVRITLVLFVLLLILMAGYLVFVDARRTELQQSRQQELALKTDFEIKQPVAANLAAYEQQLMDMRRSLQTMFRQLPSKTEMDKLLIDVSQTALSAGIDVQLFEPMTESFPGFYAERPINIRMLGNYHQFGEFVSGVAALPRVVILTMHDFSLQLASAVTDSDSNGRLILEGRVKTYRYVDEDEIAQRSAQQAQ